MIDKIKSFFKSFLLRWKTEEHLIKTCNRSTPLHRYVNLAISVAVCFTIFLFSLACIPASAADLPDIPDAGNEVLMTDTGMTHTGGSAVVPTNLTGYTVTVPAGWSCTAGLASYSLSGNISYSSVSDAPFFYFRIGYTTSLTMSYQSKENSIAFGDVSLSFGAASNLVSFTLTNLNGDDVDDANLIQWLVDNNAIFTNGSEPEPNPTVTFNRGLYKVSSTWYNSDISTQLDGMTFYSLSEGDLFIALTVQNDELIFDDENGDMHVMARNTTTGAKWIDNSGQFVYFINDESIPQSLADQIATLLEYIPDVSLTDYQRMQDSWYYGVQDGFTEGYNQASRDTEGTFLGNIFGGVFDALDKFQIFGQFSFLDFIKSIIGILALIWFLKLLAGG